MIRSICLATVVIILCVVLTTNVIKETPGTAVTEHVIHICYILSIEVAHVKACQADTTDEHTVHVSHFIGVEMAYIKAC